MTAMDGRKAKGVHLVVHGAEFGAILDKMRTHQDTIFGSFRPEFTVLLKINANSTFPYPATTSPEMLAGVIDLLNERGVQRIVVGACTSLPYLPTAKVFCSLSFDEAIEGRARLIAFDDGKWLKLAVNGHYLRRIRVSEMVSRVDRIINLSNMKTHVLADFTLGMKNLVGFTHPRERRGLHKDHLQEKIAELGTAIQADLTIVDSRKVFVSGGPNQGEVQSGDRIFVGTDPLATDIKACEYLYATKTRYHGDETLTEDPCRMRMFEHFSAEALFAARSVQWEDM